MYFYLSGAPAYDDFEMSAETFEDEVYEEPVPSKPTLTEFDVSAGVSQSNEMASKYFGPDIIGKPFLVRVEASAVDEQGISHLEYGDVMYRYVVQRPPLPDDPEQPSTAPLGTRPPKEKKLDIRTCHVDITVTEYGMQIESSKLAFSLGRDGDSTREELELLAHLAGLKQHCDQPKLEEKLCPISRIRQAAVALGAPQEALASVSIGGFHPQCGNDDCAETPEKKCCIERTMRWHVQIVDRGETLFSQRIANQCEAGPDTAPVATE